MLDTITPIIASLWAAHGGPQGPVSLTPCAVSGNNRVYRVDGGDHPPIIAKAYFRPNPGDRDRLAAEWQFLCHARQAGLSCVPYPIAHSRSDCLALYSFVAGDKLDSEQITQSHVLAAADFIRALNRDEPSDPTLPDAAEACFCLAEHLAVIERRLGRLGTIQPQLTIDHQAVELVQEIRAYWVDLKHTLLTGYDRLGLTADTPISRAERFLSPSDFGFHNALLGPDGQLRFIDFEYAGWDDIAKLVADFFFQPAIPVPADLFPLFLNQVIADRSLSPQAIGRIRLLRPLFGVKWLCILLNLFLPDMAQRRRFADPNHDELSSKTAQLVKARSAFQTLIGTPWHT